jgi:DNA repair exonuclease SbcCD nuclease subunit
VRLLHVSDCHLGTGTGPRLEDRAFTRLLEVAVELDVDAVVVTGDLFDNARVEDGLVEWAASELIRLQRPVVVLPGNHDSWGPTSIYVRPAFDVGGNLRVVRAPAGETIEFPNLEAVFWGRAVTDHGPAFRPLAGVPHRPRDRVGVVLGHGLLLEGLPGEQQRGSPIRTSELERIDWDYVALGHWPCYRSLELGSPVIACYAGPALVDATHAAGVLVTATHRRAAVCERVIVPL